MNKKKLITGIAAGVAAGAILGYLFATEKGAQTRHKIAEQTSNFFDEVVAHFVDMLQLGKDKVNQASEEAGMVTEKLKMSDHI